MKRILIVGGANGIGLAIAQEMAERTDCERVYVVDKAPLDAAYAHPKIQSFEFDLTSDDYSFFDRFYDIDALMLTAGFGRLARFRDVREEEIEASFRVNTIATMRLIRRFYARLESTETFRCGVMCSIAGFLSSPFFSVYAATKAALRIFIESVNVELLKGGSTNQILNVSPGSIAGTKFSNPDAQNQLDQTRPLAAEIIAHLEQGDDIFIPHYDDIYHNVLERYHNDFRAEGSHSYDYKVQTGRAEKA